MPRVIHKLRNAPRQKSAGKRPVHPASTPDARSQLAAIVEHSNDAIFSRTLDGVIVTWNAAAERIFGYKAAEIVGRSSRVLLPHGERDTFRKLLARIRKGELVQHCDTERLRKNGKSIPLAGHLFRIAQEAVSPNHAAILLVAIGSQHKLSNPESMKLPSALTTQSTILFPLRLIGVGTAKIESLASYLNRLANAHRVPLTTLFRQFLAPEMGPKHSLNSKSIPFVGQRAARLLFPNAASLAVVKALQNLTGQCEFEPAITANLAQITQLGDHVRRHWWWCPYCLDHPLGSGEFWGLFPIRCRSRFFP